MNTARSTKVVFNLDQNDEESKEEESQLNQKSYTTMTLFQERLDKIKARNIQVGEQCMDHLQDDSENGVLIFYTVYGRNVTITKR